MSRVPKHIALVDSLSLSLFVVSLSHKHLVYLAKDSLSDLTNVNSRLIKQNNSKNDTKKVE